MFFYDSLNSFWDMLRFTKKMYICLNYVNSNKTLSQSLSDYKGRIVKLILVVFNSK